MRMAACAVRKILWLGTNYGLLEKGIAAKRRKQLASHLNARNTINKRIPSEKDGTFYLVNNIK